MKTYLSLIFLLFCTSISAQTTPGTSPLRTTINLNKNWSFAKDPGKRGMLAVSKWMPVSLPHTWNAIDVMDDKPGYYRGIGWYRRKLVLPVSLKNKTLSLYFEGANQESKIFLNGKKIAEHTGGYTAFSIPLKQLKFDGKDEIAVSVDNSYNENIAPLTADFTFFGGLYRSVSLVATDQISFEDQQFAGPGVYVHAEKVSAASANIVIHGSLSNGSALNTNLILVSTLTTANGKKMGETKLPVRAIAGKSLTFILPPIEISKPDLWSPEHPNLYLVSTSLVDAVSGKVLDEIKTSTGIRYFSFDAESGFFLNGKPYKLIGASRHQDYAGMGNAVPKSLQVKDVELLKAMGGNFLRVAHYPQDQAVLDACDRLGILASVEIPVVNEITETEAFTENCMNMQLEMIKQNYNHPSIIIWAYMNEVLLKMKFSKEPERKQQYLRNVAHLAQQLEDLTRKTDPTRYTMMSNHGDVNGYTKAGLVKIPMLVGWNLYQGWYGGKAEDFGPNLDKIHQQMPDKPILITEFGADVDPRIHAFPAIKFDKSLEYGMHYHQVYIGDILKRPFVAGAAVWNLADFSSETREETMPHINNKGLLTIDRKPKNTYYLYKANFQHKPFVKIGDGSWQLRGGVANINENTAKQMLQVISNTDSVTLFLNGKNLGKKGVVARVSSWMVPFGNGRNELTAISVVNGIKVEDHSVIEFKLQPANMKSFKSINISLGSERQFIDQRLQQVWLPDQAYKTGGWGHIGGEVFSIKNSSRQRYGTDKDIKGTDNDPIYQTQLVGLSGYRLDVPEGRYEVILHFAELMGHGIQSVLPYNLDTLVSPAMAHPEQRIFDVYINDKLVIKNINLAAKFGIAKSVQQKFECLVTAASGINIVFKGIHGKPVLNALQVRKIE